MNKEDSRTMRIKFAERIQARLAIQASVASETASGWRSASSCVLHQLGKILQAEALTTSKDQLQLSL